MKRLVTVLVLLATTLSLPALATIDQLTGEPIPAGDRAVAPATPLADGQRDGDLELLCHLADGTTKAVRALGENLALRQNGAWLEAFDLSGMEPQLVSQYLMPAQPSDMQVDGTIVYLPLRKGAGLFILDYADPAAPQLLGSLSGYDMLSVAVADGIAFCGLGSNGFITIDVSDLANPVSMGVLDTPGSANGTAIQGDLLAVALGNDGLGLYDVSDLLNPTNLVVWPTDGFCTYVRLAGDLAYFSGNFGLEILDISLPSVPAPVGGYDPGETCYELVLTGDDCYLAGLHGLSRVDVSNPAAPVVLAEAYYSSGLSCAVAGDKALLGARFSGLHVLTASMLEPLASVPNGGFSTKLHFDGDFLYVADLAGGVRIYDLADPTAPVLTSYVPTDPNCQDLAVADGLLLPVNSNNTGAGLLTVDVSDPAAPALLAEFNTANGTMGIDLTPGRAVLANGFGGLLYVDITDPANPANLGETFFGAMTFDVMTVGDIAFVASFGGGMLSVDIADPANMVTLDQEIGWGFLNALDITDQIAWVADGQAGLRVVDISDPADLVTLATLATASQARDVVRSRVGSPYVYVADDFYGLRQMDITDPAAPVLLGSYPSADRGMGVDAADGLVVLAAGETGVYIYRNPAVVVVEGGDEVEPAELPGRPLLTAAPNPFNPRLEVAYMLPRAGQVRLEIFDARGRLVRTLLNASAPAGAGSLVWNGGDTAGRPVASGVYHLRLVTEEAVTTRSVTLVR